MDVGDASLIAAAIAVAIAALKALSKALDLVASKFKPAKPLVEKPAGCPDHTAILTKMVAQMTRMSDSQGSITAELARSSDTQERMVERLIEVSTEVKSTSQDVRDIRRAVG